MRILVDTNVWIDYLNGESYAKKINELIILTTAVNVSLSEIFEFAEKQNLSGMGLSFIDVGLAMSSIKSGSLLWTSDKKLKNLAEKHNLYYKSK